MTRAYVGSVDQGTTSTRFVVYEAANARDPSTYEAIASHQIEHAQKYPRPGWCAHDGEEIFERAVTCAREALKRASIEASDLACVGITNQRETTMAWRRSDGTPSVSYTHLTLPTN